MAKNDRETNNISTRLYEAKQKNEQEKKNKEQQQNYRKNATVQNVKYSKGIEGLNILDQVENKRTSLQAPQNI